MAQDMSITITLPIPDAKLSLNARVHWAARAKLTKAHRKLACVKGINALGSGAQPRWEKATARVRYYWPDRRRRDRDNAAARLKAYWDGMVDAGILLDDAGLTHEPMEMLLDRGNPRVEIEIRNGVAA